MVGVPQPIPQATRPATNQRLPNWHTNGEPPSPCKLHTHSLVLSHFVFVNCCDTIAYRTRIPTEFTASANETVRVILKLISEPCGWERCLALGLRQYRHIDLLLNGLILSAEKIVAAPATDPTPLADKWVDGQTAGGDCGTAAQGDWCGESQYGDVIAQIGGVKIRIDEYFGDGEFLNAQWFGVAGSIPFAHANAQCGWSQTKVKWETEMSLAYSACEHMIFGYIRKIESTMSDRQHI